jgi:outer membrane receptor protein involved in Fe transport
MFPLSRQSGGPPGLLLALLLLLFLGMHPSRLAAKDASCRTFAIATAEAEVTLETFSEQSGAQLVYLIEDVRGVTTHHVRGSFTISEALQRLVAGTVLRVEQDEKTGAFVIKRKRSTPSPAAPTTNPDTPTHPAMRKTLPARLGAALAVLTASTLTAQTAPAASTPTQDEKDAAILLTPFEVKTDNDNGYTATSTLAGGRTDSPLKLTSAAISVMTSQFLEDIGSTNFRTAGEWALNWVSFPESNTSISGGFSINYRNMGDTFASRNYFIWYVESDSYNTERYEFARGPNGVLFGDAGAGGISTTWTKRPRFDRATNSLTTRVDSYGGIRASIDLSRPVTKKFALRLNSFYESAPSWREHTDNTRNGTHLAGAVRLTDKSQFRFEGELGLQRRVVYPNYYADQGSFWNGTTAYLNSTSPAPSTSGTGIARISSTNNYFVYIPGTINGGYNDYGPYYQSTGTGLGLLPDGVSRSDIPNAPRLPYKKFNFQPPDSIARLMYYTYSLYFDHRFSDNLFVQVAYNRLRNDRQAYGSQTLFSTYRVDVNKVLPGDLPNPNFGKAFTDAERVRSLQGNIVSDVRALVNYRYVNSWLNQSFSFIGGSRLDRFDSYSRTLRRVNGASPSIAAPANLIRDRRYWDQVGVPLGNIPSIPGVALDFVPTSVSHQRKNLDYTQVASTSRFFNDKLSVMFGFRRDGVTNVQQTTSGIPVDPVTSLPQLGAVITPPGKAPVAVLGGKSRGEFSPVSRNVGAVYYLRPWVGLFANYSETFAAPNNGNNLIDGGTPEISKSKGKDMGVKFDLLDGKVNATLSYYTSQQNGLLITGTRATEINRIWTNLNRNDLASLSYRDTQDRKGDGYEFEVIANPMRSLRLTANLALPKTSAINLEPGLVTYYNANLKTWQDGAPTSQNPGQVATDITTIRNYIASLAPGTPLNNTYKYTGNIYATYSFLNGRLKDFAFGGGANLRGKSKIASTLANTYDYLYANDYFVVAAHASYRYRFSKKLNTRFQLNVSNVLDNDKYIANTYSTYRVGNVSTNPQIQVPGTIRLPDPRKFTLSATFDF